MGFPDMEFKPLGNDRVTGKAFDNRAGCTMLIEALRQMKDVKATVHAVFIVQEEVGLKGAAESNNIPYQLDVGIGGTSIRPCLY